jgi:serine/threonine-protein kinase
MMIEGGTQLGAYKIVERIGTGGMGEVYRAIDPRIGREVAIKVLPSSFAQDPDRLTRFEQEARAAGMLNHPGILNVHDIGHENGVHFLILELLEGETLREKLKSPLSQRKVIDFALQIAKALAAAHDKGIIHRDLKPENLFITKDGRIKILDFGLAKLTQPEAASVQVSKLETNAPVSAAGMILGTVGYMSPEQVRGKAADGRSDIFAFGLILYEMISGKRAFHGDTAADTMSAILNKEPEELSTSNLNLSPAMIRIVEHCIEKDPSQRFQSMHDVAFYLDTVSGTSSSVSAPPIAAGPSKVKAFLPWILAAFMTIVAFAAFFASGKKQISQFENSVMRFIIPLEAKQRTVFNAYGTLAISPDGRSIIYTGVENQQIKLFLRNMDTFESHVIPGTEGARAPFFSPDGKWLGFLTDHELRKVRLSGDTPVTLCRLANPRGASWGDDGTIVFSPFYYSGLSKISSNGGTPQSLTTVDRAKGERNHRWPFVLPGSKVALFTIGHGGSWSDATIGAVRLDTGERKEVLQHGFGARYLPTGHLVFGRGDSLYVIGFDLQKLETIGDAIALTSGISDSGAGTLEYAFSQNGILITLPAGITYDEGRHIAMLNRKGERIPGFLDSLKLNDPRISPDDRRLTGFQGFEIWIYDLDRGTSTRLTSGARTGWPRWTPDGKRVTYSSEAAGFWNIFWRASDGSDQEQPLFKIDSVVNPIQWSPDNKKLLLYKDSPETNSDLVIFDSTDGKLHEFVATPATEIDGVFSPDGKWIAYTSDESGRFEIYVRSAGGPQGRWQVSTNGGGSPRWKQPDELIYLQGENVMRVSVRTAPTFTATTPEILFTGPYYQIDVTSDHQRFIGTLQREAADDYLNVVVNWFDDIRKQAPLPK